MNNPATFVSSHLSCCRPNFFCNPQIVVAACPVAPRVCFSGLFVQQVNLVPSRQFTWGTRVGGHRQRLRHLTLGAERSKMGDDHQKVKVYVLHDEHQIPV